MASGSGVIIRPEGIVLTNSHVVANATKVTVQLVGSEKILPAEVIQSDPRTDLAIVKITEKGTYPVAQLGDAGTVQVGDWAIAIGSPFRLYSTMTVGVISAVGRQLRAPTDDYAYRDLLQTDASINPGNSGGPLTNIRGEVVGINFMIYSPGESAGSVGIGFAIPINTYTKRIIETLITGKTFDRGRLGVVVKNLDAAMREAYGVTTGGVYVDSVMPGQAGDKAGLKAEDVIVEFNGVKITDIDQFVSLVEQTKPGTEVPVIIVRNKKEMKLNATVGAAPSASKPVIDQRRAGMSISTLTPEIADQLGVTEAHGVVVTNVAVGSPADDAGLKRGDIIVRVGAGDGAEDIKSEDNFWEVFNAKMENAKNGVLMRVRRGTFMRTITFPAITEKALKE